MPLSSPSAYKTFKADKSQPITSIAILEESNILITAAPKSIISWNPADLSILCRREGMQKVQSITLINSDLLFIVNTIHRLQICSAKTLELLKENSAVPIKEITGAVLNRKSQILVYLTSQGILEIAHIEKALLRHKTRLSLPNIVDIKPCENGRYLNLLGPSESVMRIDPTTLNIAKTPQNSAGSGGEFSIRSGRRTYHISTSQKKMTIDAFDKTTTKPVTLIEVSFQGLEKLYVFENLKLLIVTGAKGYVFLFKLNDPDMPLQIQKGRIIAALAMSMEVYCNGGCINLRTTDHRVHPYRLISDIVMCHYFEAHRLRILDLAVNQSKNHMLTLSKDQTIKVWSLSSHSFVAEIKLPSDVDFLTVIESRKIIVTATSKANLSVYNLDNYQEERVFVPELPSSKVLHLRSSLFSSGIDLYFDDGIIVRLDASSFCRPTMPEQYFILTFFSENVTDEKFRSGFQSFRAIYESSNFLKSYFNIYFAAAISGLDSLLPQLYETEEIPYPTYSNQISPINMLAAMNSIHLKPWVEYVHEKQIPIMMDQSTIKNLMVLAPMFGFSLMLQSIKSLTHFDTDGNKINKVGPFKDPITVIQKPENILDQQTYGSIPKIDRGRNVAMDFYDLGVRWDFTDFTETSQLFLELYSTCNSDEFVLSPYRHIIESKWRRFFPIILIHALFNWAHVVLYCLCISNPSAIGLFVADFIIIGINMLFEIISLLAHPVYYLKNVWNYLDWFNILMCISFLVVTQNEEEYSSNDGYRIMQVISLLGVIFRGFTMFKVFTEFAVITRMTYAMLSNTYSIFFMIIYFSVCWSVPLSKSKQGNSFAESIMINYNLVFGNIPEFGERQYLEIILVVVASIFLPIFLINFLIAKLSSVYSELEIRQKVLILKEMASSLTEFEFLEGLIRRIFGHKPPVRSGYVYIIADQRLMIKQQETEKMAEDVEQVLRTLPSITKELAIMKAKQEQQSEILNRIIKKLDLFTPPQTNS